MFSFLFRKIVKNKWLILSILLGFTLAVAIVTSVPAYSSAVLKRMLIKDVEQYEKENHIFPGSFAASRQIVQKDYENFDKTFTELDAEINKTIDHLGMKPYSKKYNIVGGDMYVGRINADGKLSNEKGSGFKIEALFDIESNIKILEGRIFSPDPLPDGTYEVIVSEKTMNTLGLKIDEIYSMRYRDYSESQYFKVKVVGLYTLDKADNIYWVDKDWEHVDGFLMHPKAFINHYSKSPNTYINNISWFYALDYKSIDVRNIKSILNKFDSRNKELSAYQNINTNFAISDVLSKYIQKQNELKITLWTIQIPVILIIVLYIFMISGLIVERDANEISLLKSRGASRFQLLNIYLLEYGLIGLVGILLGPPISLFICKLLGASDGFLKFVNRAPLDVSISYREWIYAIFTGVFFIIILLIPTFSIASDSIVIEKRKKARSKKPLWEKFYIDFLLLGISLYSIYSYKSFEKIVNVSQIDAASMPISPTLYIAFTLFIISIGLLYLRLFPYIVKLIFTLGKNKWTAPMYSSLINVSRNRGRDGFLIIFLILTLSVGIFNLKSASTINTLSENKIKYLNGADIVMSPWRQIVENGDNLKSGSDNGPGTLYKNVDFKPYSNIEGIESVTKVIPSASGTVLFNNKFSTTNSFIMGIIPEEFGKTAWFDTKLLPHHWYHYLNLIAKEPKGVLISKSLADEMSIRLGDIIDVRWDKNLYVESYVYGIVDYWPGYDANNEYTKHLIVMNYNYVDSVVPNQPYDVWMKKSPNASNDDIYKDISTKHLSYEAIKTVHEGLYKLKNDPIVQGTNGTLTLCFLSSLFITCLGFIIYWSLSIKNRTLQFGILRAIGLSMKKIIAILISEQVLISGLGAITGIIVGLLSSNVFVPLVNLSSASKEKVLPFRPISFIGNYISLGLFIIVVLTCCLFILIRIVKKIKIDQALKLGED
ncbi:ABC transporter permease [Desnuesiella massiliensis]|uniref:ABC transporter permease n=1 Tax=Desnuesiella massiliensis TaxID=1650662 RepID=UPI0006E42D93|nr:FtsX-like permease family protein [Desnuesiella massiliensis]